MENLTLKLSLKLFSICIVIVDFENCTERRKGKEEKEGRKGENYTLSFSIAVEIYQLT